MAKKIYHIPLDGTRVFIKENRADINKLLNDKQYLQYNQKFGKTHYELEIEKFITFFHINKNIAYSLQTINYLSSSLFFENIFTLLNFNQFDFIKSKINQKEFFYGFCYILHTKNNKLFEYLLEKLFIHFHSTLNNNTNTNIDFKEMAKELLKMKKLTLKESFGENESNAYFKIFITDTPNIEVEGSSIKTLRKKAYRKLFYKLLDYGENDKILKRKTEVYNLLEQIKSEC